MSLLSRLQIVLLILLCCLAVARLFSGPPSPRGAIKLSGLEARELAQQSFQVSGPLQVAVNAVGSLDERQGARGFAAYPWIIRDNTGEVVWSMNVSNTILNGSLAYVEGEELVMDSGTYTLYFATYGQLQHYSRSVFQRDRRMWKAVIHSPDGKDALRPIVRTLDVSSDNLIWEAVSLGKNEKREYFFEVRRPAELEIYAIGELGSQDEVQPVDYSLIEDVVSGQVIWQLSRDNTTWAGGVQENRMFRGNHRISPGVYRATAATNSRHHYDGWTGNPPFIPEDWGFRLSTSDQEAVSTFDPWMQRNPVIAFAQVGDDEEHSRSFSVLDTATVVLYALGEITGPDNGYDLARLERLESSGEAMTLWEMSWEGSVHAGGARKNRKETEFLRLEPGEYRLHYESDGSHSYESWNSRPPDYPERWGVAMFSVESQGSAIVLDLLPEPPPAPPIPVE